MKFSVLGSGSRGNCTVVKAGSTRLLIDAGFSGKEIDRRLNMVGIDARSLTAIVVTHEHDDHIRGIGVLARRFNIPIYANAATHRAAAPKINHLPIAREFGVGESFAINEFSVHPFAVSHDAVDPVGFIISDGRRQLGYCTDTGMVTRLIQHHLQQCQAVILEANHDVEMLRNGPYPLLLQQRVLSNQGHLANETSLALASLLAKEQLQLLVLAHLSEINNHPDVVRRVAHHYLSADPTISVTLSRQEQPLPLVSLGS